MTEPLSLVIVAEHPARTIGFTRVATDIACELLARGVVITYVGFFSDHAPDAVPPPFELLPVVGPVEAADALAERLDAGGDDALEILFVGRVPEVTAFSDRLDSLDVRRWVRLTFYDAVDYAPAPAALSELAAYIDRLVPATVRAEVALREVSVIDAAIPHAVHLGRFRPPDPDHRRGVRADTLGVDDDRPIVGTFSRNSVNKRFDLATRVIAHVAHGSYVRCRSCGRISVAPLGLDGRLGEPPDRCRRCGSVDTDEGTPRDLVWLLHTEDVDRAGLKASGGWDLDLLIDRYDLGSVLWWQRDLPVGQGIPIDELVERMGACDVHLLLSDCGGWELTMLETAACGVANLVADAGAFGEYTAPFAEVVPVVDRYWAGHGHRGEADLGGALDALLRLLDDADLRDELGRAGIATARAYSTAEVGRLWHQRLESWAN